MAGLLYKPPLSLVTSQGTSYGAQFDEITICRTANPPPESSASSLDLRPTGTPPTIILRVGLHIEAADDFNWHSSKHCFNAVAANPSSPPNARSGSVAVAVGSVQTKQSRCHPYQPTYIYIYIFTYNYIGVLLKLLALSKQRVPISLKSMNDVFIHEGL